MRVSIAALSISAAGAFSTSRNTLAAPRRPAASSSQLQMLDAAVIQGGAAAFGGLAVGLGMAWFSEQQVEQGGCQLGNHGNRSAAAPAERKRCVRFPRRGHNDLVHDPSYWPSVASFVESVFDGG